MEEQKYKSQLITFEIVQPGAKRSTGKQRSDTATVGQVRFLTTEGTRGETVCY